MRKLYSLCFSFFCHAEWGHLPNCVTIKGKCVILMLRVGIRSQPTVGGWGGSGWWCTECFPSTVLTNSKFEKNEVLPLLSQWLFWLSHVYLGDREVPNIWSLFSKLGDRKSSAGYETAEGETKQRYKHYFLLLGQATHSCSIHPNAFVRFAVHRA